MTKKRGATQTERESLVPAVEQEEGRIRAYLDEARAEARRIVEDAEAAAREKIRRALEDLPRLMEEKRGRILETHRAEAEDLRGRLDAETKRILEAAEKNREGAVSLIVSLVWPLADERGPDRK